jgi:hypothetical protein
MALAFQRRVASWRAGPLALFAYDGKGTGMTFVATLGLSLCLLPPPASYETSTRTLQIASRTVVRPSFMQTRATAPARRDSLWNGALIGAAIGGGYGAFVVAKLDHEVSPGQRASIVPVTVGIGAGVGILIDYLRR